MSNRTLAILVVAGAVALAAYWFLIRPKLRPGAVITSPPNVRSTTSGGSLKAGVSSVATGACVAYTAAKTGGVATPACALVAPVVNSVVKAGETAVKTGAKILAAPFKALGF